MLRYVVLMLLPFALHAPAYSAAPASVSVYIQEQCGDDSVGKRIVYFVKEGIAKSSNMSIEDEYTNSLVQFRIVCLAPDKDEDGSVSRYAYAVTVLNVKGHYDFYITHGVGTCGTKRASECAESLVVSLAGAIQDLRDKVKNGKFEYEVAKPRAAPRG